MCKVTKPYTASENRKKSKLLTNLNFNRCDDEKEIFLTRGSSVSRYMKPDRFNKTKHTLVMMRVSHKPKTNIREVTQVSAHDRLFQVSRFTHDEYLFWKKFTP